MKRLVITCFLLALAAAQPSFLSSLQSHPSWRAAEARYRAAQINAQLSPNWIELDSLAGWARSELDQGEPCPFLNDPDPTNDIFCGFISPDLPEKIGQAQIGVTIRPIPFGDYADKKRQALIERQLAVLDFRNAKARLESEALRTALSVLEAERGLELALEGRRFAKKALDATQIRADKGAANPRELRDAKLSFARAEEQVLSAQESLTIAQSALRTFTGKPPPTPPWFRTPLPRTEPPEITRARLQLELARVAHDHAGRDLLPVVQFEYRQKLDDDNLVGVTLESRTLGTRLYYDYSSYANAERTRTDRQLRIGARLNLSLDTWSRLEQARNHVTAAEAALKAARRTASVKLEQRAMAIKQSVRAVSLAERALENAKKAEQETEKRLDLGLSTPLEHLRSQLDRLKAEFQLTKARHDVLRAQLDYLVYLGIPPSEVWR